MQERDIHAQFESTHHAAHGGEDEGVLAERGEIGVAQGRELLVDLEVPASAARHGRVVGDEGGLAAKLRRSEHREDGGDHHRAAHADA